MQRNCCDVRLPFFPLSLSNAPGKEKDGMVMIGGYTETGALRAVDYNSKIARCKTRNEKGRAEKKIGTNFEQRLRFMVTVPFYKIVKYICAGKND